MKCFVPALRQAQGDACFKLCESSSIFISAIRVFVFVNTPKELDGSCVSSEIQKLILKTRMLNKAM